MALPILGALVIGTAAPQDAPHFDVVAIKTVPLNAPPLMRDPGESAVKPGGQFSDPRVTIASMIAFAYNIRNFKLLGGIPGWAQAQYYTIAAKAGPDYPNLSSAANRERVQLMMRAMLAERFHLQIHTERRDERVYRLDAAKGGLKITTVPPPDPPETEGLVQAAMGDRDGRMIAKKATMAGLARALSVFLDHPVIDVTGLSGYYDFDIHWRELDASSGAPTPGVFGAEGIGLLMSNLQSQLGLRLTEGTGPVERWVVDHVEAPTDN